ncbi:hypothetical protein, partial [Mycolicibacterium sp. CBMA 361]|uniref:hypothetical protein n=1 Tax=Mycolicibacterium sp. CBMA 361 TaxID=2606610 RepID=UPI001EF0404E
SRLVHDRCADTKDRLPPPTVPPPSVPGPTAAVIRPDELKGTDARTAECYCVFQVDVGMFHINNFEKKFVLIVDMHGRPQERAVLGDLMRE